MGPNRSRFDIISEILIAAKDDWAAKTQIMYKANVSFNQLQKYLTFLLTKGFLDTMETERGLRYQITEKGFKLLHDYEELRKTLAE